MLATILLSLLGGVLLVIAAIAFMAALMGNELGGKMGRGIKIVILICLVLASACFYGAFW